MFCATTNISHKFEVWRYVLTNKFTSSYHHIVSTADWRTKALKHSRNKQLPGYYYYLLFRIVERNWFKHSLGCKHPLIFWFYNLLFGILHRWIPYCSNRFAIKISFVCLVNHVPTGKINNRKYQPPVFLIWVVI